MKIMIVTEAWDPQINGVVRTLKMTTRELGNLGHEVRMLTPDQFMNMPCPTYPEINLALATVAQVRKKIDAFEPDVLHIATEGPLGWAARKVAVERGWPFSTGYHSRFTEYIQMRIGLPLGISYHVLRKFHNAGVATMVPTMAMLETLRERGFEKVVHWSRGVNTELFNPHGEKITRGPEPVFLHVGRIAVEKSVEDFLALDLPGEKWVAGEGPARKDLQKKYPQVRWFGWLTGEALATLYRSADVFVFPSRTDTFGLVMIEAMACGTPVAAFPVTGPIDVVPADGGVLHEDLRKASLDALSFDRVQVAEAALKFSWTAATNQFLSSLRPIPRAAASGAAATAAVTPELS
jgi:glycosyltransferase involved in cell wall biosynthesis